MTALAGVVVDDIQNDLESGIVQRRHHLLELPHLLAQGADRTVRRMRGEVAQSVVSPVVGEPSTRQEGLRDEVVHR